LWRWQRNFFETRGPAAWSCGTVPHYVTSTPFIADAYARVVLAHLEDSLGHTTPREAVPIVELGAGSGRFAIFPAALRRAGAALASDAPAFRVRAE
jgi:hypothetical protein